MLQRSFTGFLGFAALIVLLLAVPSAASAANSCDVGTVDKTWVGNTSSDWFTASNWSPSGVPGTGSDVCVPSTNPSPNPVPAIATGSTANAASIESFKPINVDAGSLRANSSPQASVFHDDLNLAAGTTLDNRGSLTVEGDLSWSAATITSGGAVGTVTIASGGTTTATTVDTQRGLNHQTLRINGAGTFAGNDPDVFNDDTYLANGATLEIGSGGSLDLQGDQDIIDNGGGTNSVHVLSGGTLSRSTGSTTSFISVQLDNDGTVSAAAASTTASPALSFLSGSGTATSGGQFAPASGAVIDLGGGTYKINGASFAGSGTTQLSSGTLDATGTNTVASGATLALNSSTLSNAGTMTVNGTLGWENSSTISGAGTTTIVSGAALTVSGDNTARFLDTGTLRIDGSATFEGGTGGNFLYTYLQNGAKLEIGSGGTLDLQDDQGIYYNGGANPLLHVLAGGTLTRTSAAGMNYAEIAVPLDNDSTSSVKSEAGTLRLDGGGGGETSVGKFDAAAGATIDFAAGTYQLAGASFAGDGTVSVSGGEVDTSGTTSVAGATTLALSGSTLSNAGTMTVNGTLGWENSSTISGAGTTTIASGGALTGSGDNTARFLDTGTLRLNGTGTFEGGTGGNFFSTYLQNGAKLEIGSGGTLDLQDDQGIFENGGVGNLLHVLAGGTLTRTSAALNYAEITVPLDNDSTSSVKSEAGTLRIDGPGGGETSVGKFEAAAGATIDFAGDTHQIGTGASLAGAGTILVSSGTLSASGTTSVAAATTVNLSNSTLANTGTMTVHGTLEWDDNSTINGAGTTTIASDGVLTNGGGDQRFLDTGTVRIDGTATFTGDQDDPGSGDDLWMSNNALLEIGSGGSLDLQRAQDLAFNGGTMPDVHVLAGGTLSRSTGPGEARVLVDFDNDGTVDVGAGALSVDASFGGGGFANYNQATDLLSGGTYVVRNGSTFEFPGADVKTNGAAITLDGAGSGFQDESAQDGFRDLATNNASGTLRLRGGRNFTRTGAFTNNGVIDLAGTTTFTTTGNYTQSASGTLATEIAGPVAGTSYGQVVAGNAAAVAGTLDVALNYVPQTGDVFDVVRGATRTGTFSTVNGQGFDVKYLADRVRLTPPSLVIANRTQPEGNAGSTNARFKVTLSSPSAGTVAADYDTADGSATAPADYASTSGTATLTPGQTSKFIDVPVNGDTLDEVNEKFNVVLSNPQNSEIADDTGIGTITDDDPPPAVSIGDSSHAEGGALVFTLSLAAPSAKQVKIGYATAPGTATAPADYTSKSGTVTFPPGQTSKTVSVSSAQDTTDEDDETFSVNLSSPVNTTIGDGTGIGTITDNDAPPTLSINDASRTEGSAVNGFNISLSAVSGKSVTVTYSTIDATAKAPGDYTAKTATVTFAPGQTSKQVTINTVQDALDENDETFTVKLTNPQSATISDSTGLGTILDNDPTPSLSINDVSHAEGGAYVFTVTLSAASSKQVKADYATADGSATAPSDYASKAGTLTFAPGDTTKTISVSSVGDHAVEPDEAFAVNLTNGVNAGISDPSGTGTLVNND